MIIMIYTGTELQKRYRESNVNGIREITSSNYTLYNTSCSFSLPIISGALSLHILTC